MTGTIIMLITQISKDFLKTMPIFLMIDFSLPLLEEWTLMLTQDLILKNSGRESSLRSLIQKCLWESQPQNPLKDLFLLKNWTNQFRLLKTLLEQELLIDHSILVKENQQPVSLEVQWSTEMHISKHLLELEHRKSKTDLNQQLLMNWSMTHLLNHQKDFLNKHQKQSYNPALDHLSKEN